MSQASVVTAAVAHQTVKRAATDGAVRQRPAKIMVTQKPILADALINAYYIDNTAKTKRLIAENELVNFLQGKISYKDIFYEKNNKTVKQVIADSRSPIYELYPLLKLILPSNKSSKKHNSLVIRTPAEWRRLQYVDEGGIIKSNMIAASRIILANAGIIYEGDDYKAKREVITAIPTNALKFTRILRSLNGIGAKEEAKKIYNILLKTDFPTFYNKNESIKYWSEAMNFFVASRRSEDDSVL